MRSVIGLAFALTVVLVGAQSSMAACNDPAAVAAARAAVDAQCPCNGFPNHGQYVKCARGVANMLVDANLLPKNCKGSVVKCAARSTCGKPGSVTCCRTNKKGVTKCSTKKDATKCKAPKGGSACVGLFSSCCDACSPTGCVGATPTPTPTPTPTNTPAPTGTPYGSASQAFLVNAPSLLQ